MSHAVDPFRPVLRQRSVLRRHKPQQEQRKTRETQRGHAEECLPGLFIHKENQFGGQGGGSSFTASYLPASGITLRHAARYACTSLHVSVSSPLTVCVLTGNGTCTTRH